MSMHSWAYDQPTGVYKNHALSSDIRMAAVAESCFSMFVSAEAGYGKGKGENVTITRISNVEEPTQGRITELQDIPEDVFSLSTTSITVTEWGRSLPFTSFAADLAFFDLKSKIQAKLKDQMRLTMDRAAAAAYKTAKVKAIPDGVASITMDTDGTPSTAATVNANLYHVEQIRDYMKTTLHVPAYEGDNYICLASTKFLRGIKNDPKWEMWKIHTDPEAKFKGEVGRIEGIVFKEVSNTNCLSGAKGTGGVLGEAVVFGADSVTMAVALDPELRAEVPRNFGRFQSVAWYAIMEYGIVWDTANDGEARIVHVTSS